MSEIKKILAHNLSRILEERKMPKGVFAKGLGLTRQTVCNVTHAKGDFSLRTLQKISAFLNVNEWELVCPPDEFKELRKLIKTIPSMRRYDFITRLVQEAHLLAHSDK